MWKANFGAAVALALTAHGAALAQTAAVTDNRVVIHHIGPLTGVLAGSNKEALDGAKLYLDLMNAKGGVAGRQVVLETVDDKQDPKETVRLYKELIEQRKILTFFMPRTTPSIEATLPISQENGIPMVAPQTGGAAITAPFKKYAFAIRATYQAEVERAIELQHSIGMRRFGFMVASDAYGKDSMAGADRAMQKLNIKPVAIEQIDNRNPDVRKAVETMLTMRPDVVVMITSSKAASDFVKGYKAGGGYTQFISLSNTSNNDYVKGLGEHSRGAIVMQVFPSPYSPTTRVAREFIAASKDKNIPVSYASLQGYISAKVLVEGLRRAGRNLTSESLTRALESFREFDVGDYIVEFDNDTRLGSTFVEATIISTNGRFMR
jgi:ABC-type branched-subunit amino acid transport system substrate-binding protein